MDCGQEASRTVTNAPPTANAANQFTESLPKVVSLAGRRENSTGVDSVLIMANTNPQIRAAQIEQATST
jgi:hypothetical protein